MKKAEIEKVKEKVKETLTCNGWKPNEKGGLFHMKHSIGADGWAFTTTYETSFREMKVMILASRMFHGKQESVIYTSAFYKDVVFFDNGTVKIGSVIL